jgi:hypothetical protein
LTDTFVNFLIYIGSSSIVFHILIPQELRDTAFFTIILYLFLDETFLMYMLKNQISSLVIESIRKLYRSTDANTCIFTHILNTFINLQYLKFHSSFVSSQRISFGYSPPTVFSSTLLELHVKVASVDDCLCRCTMFIS